MQTNVVHNLATYYILLYSVGTDLYILHGLVLFWVLGNLGAHGLVLFWSVGPLLCTYMYICTCMYNYYQGHVPHNGVGKPRTLYSSVGQSRPVPASSHHRDVMIIRFKNRTTHSPMFELCNVLDHQFIVPTNNMPFHTSSNVWVNS
jgi:hypothetical protein